MWKLLIGLPRPKVTLPTQLRAEELRRIGGTGWLEPTLLPAVEGFAATDGAGCPAAGGSAGAAAFVGVPIGEEECASEPRRSMGWRSIILAGPAPPAATCRERTALS